MFSLQRLLQWVEILYKRSFLFLSMNVRLITYFGNFVFGCSSLRLCDFLCDVFRLQGKMGKTKWKINKLLRNILVTLSPKMRLPKCCETLRKVRDHHDLGLGDPGRFLGSSYWVRLLKTNQKSDKFFWIGKSEN